MEDGPERRKKLIEIYDERDNRKEDIRGHQEKNRLHIVKL